MDRETQKRVDQDAALTGIPFRTAHKELSKGGYHHTVVPADIGLKAEKLSENSEISE